MFDQDMAILDPTSQGLVLLESQGLVDTKLNKLYQELKLEAQTPPDPPHLDSMNLFMYTYIYIYICVCVCACVCVYYHMYNITNHFITTSDLPHFLRNGSVITMTFSISGVIMRTPLRGRWKACSQARWDRYPIQRWVYNGICNGIMDDTGIYNII